MNFEQIANLVSLLEREEKRTKKAWEQAKAKRESYKSVYADETSRALDEKQNQTYNEWRNALDNLCEFKAMKWTAITKN